MALRNRSYDESTKIKGVNLADEERDLELGSFTSLANYIPADVYAIKKKRGIARLDGRSLLLLETARDALLLETGDNFLIE